MCRHIILVVATWLVSLMKEVGVGVGDGARSRVDFVFADCNVFDVGP